MIEQSTFTEEHKFEHADIRSRTRMDGEINDVWVRATVCFRKIDGHWKVTHEHMSVPYDMETSKASVDLKP